MLRQTKSTLSITVITAILVLISNNLKASEHHDTSHESPTITSARNELKELGTYINTYRQCPQIQNYLKRGRKREYTEKTLSDHAAIQQGINQLFALLPSITTGEKETRDLLEEISAIDGMVRDTISPELDVSLTRNSSPPFYRFVEILLNLHSLLFWRT